MTLHRPPVEIHKRKTIPLATRVAVLKRQCAPEKVAEIERKGGKLKDIKAIDAVKTAAAYKGDACLEWPFSRTSIGYGQLAIEGKNVKAHRAVCTIAHGQPPTKKHHAAHNCGNRGCVNPQHLRWATAKQNGVDRVRHGTSCRGERSGKAKLSASDVRTIRNRHGTVTLKALAAEYGIHPNYINQIVNREVWGHLK